MKEEKVMIKDPIGIHARPAALLVQEIKDFESKIEFEKNGKVANAKSLISIMGLGAKKDDEITVRVDGADEDEAIKKIVSFINEKL